jgi:tRNA (adenine37-N6)-methyltransferase
MKIDIKPIGIINTPYKKAHDVPFQVHKSQNKGRVTVYKEFAEGLNDVDGFSYITIIYYFHKAKGYKLKSKPYLDDIPRGIFAIRGPHRPNHIGVTTVRLLKRIGRELIIKEMDMINGSPLLDIKPYVPSFDERKNVKIGWLKDKI